jgi:hypothetical protein
MQEFSGFVFIESTKSTKGKNFELRAYSDKDSKERLASREKNSDVKMSGLRQRL